MDLGCIAVTGVHAISSLRSAWKAGRLLGEVPEILRATGAPRMIETEGRVLWSEVREATKLLEAECSFMRSVAGEVQRDLNGIRFPEDPNQLFPEHYTGLTKEVKPNGNIDFTAEAGERTYKIEYHVKHSGEGHYDGDHYHVLKLGETPKPGKTKPPFFRLPNLDPNTPTQGGTFAPGDLLPTKNNRGGK